MKILIAIGAFIAVILGVLFITCGRKYEGYCRSCWNKGIKKKIHFAFIPKDWTCKECRKEIKEG